MEPFKIGLIILILVILIVIYKRTEGFWGGLDYRRSFYPNYYPYSYPNNYPYYYYPSLYPYYYPYYNYYYTPCIETVDGSVVCEN